MVTQEYAINLIPGVSAPLIIHCSYGDQGTKITLDVYNNSELYDCTGQTVSVHGVRADNFNWGPIPCTVNKNKISFVLTTDMTGCAGPGLAEATIGTIGTANFCFMVERGTWCNGTTQKDDISVYQAILNFVQNNVATAQSVESVVTALNQEISTRSSADTALQNNLDNATESLQNQLDTEITERETENQSLLEQLSTEVNTRSTTDTLLQKQIDELVSPSGEAPSAAEVQNIRIGADGITYPTAGDAVRANDTKLINCFNALGVIAPTWEQGGLGFSNGNPYDSANRSRTAEFIEIGASADFVATIPADHLLSVLYYKADKTYLTYVGNLSTVYYGQTPSNAMYMKLQVSRDNTSAAVPANYGDDCKTYVFSKSLMRAFTDFGIRWLQLTSASAASYSTIANFPINTVTYAVLSWLSTADDLPTGSGYYYIFTLGRAVIEYNAIQIAIDPFASAQTIFIRTRTTVSGGYTKWVKIGSRVLNATGDDTDRTAEINAMLTTYGTCELGEGDFYVAGVILPNMGTLKGAGNKTRIILKSDVTNGYAIKMGHNSCIMNLRVAGQAEPYNDWTSASTIGMRNAIIFHGSMSGDVVNPLYRCTIENVMIHDFAGSGIRCSTTGGGYDATLHVNNCYIFRCDAGINIAYWSEFHRFTNVSATYCYYGCIDNGGNCNFANCDFSGNTVGLLIDNSNDQSRNNSHGTFSACSFNHSGNNSGTAIRILKATAGEIFTGCQIFFGAIEIENSIGIRFVGANIGRQVPISVTNSTVVIFSDCTMYNAEASPLTQSGNTALKFTECYNRDGSVYNPMAA